MSSPAFATILRIPAIVLPEGIPQGSGNLAPNFRRPLSFALPPCCRLVSIGSCTPFIRLVFGFLLDVPATVTTTAPASRASSGFAPFRFVQLFLAWTGGTVRTPPSPPFFRLYRTCRRRPPLSLSCLHPCFSALLALSRFHLPRRPVLSPPPLHPLMSPPPPRAACFLFTLAYSTRCFFHSPFCANIGLQSVRWIAAAQK